MWWATTRSRLHRLSGAERRRLAEASLALLLARALVRLVPLRVSTRLLGLHSGVDDRGDGDAPRVASDAELQEARAVGWAVQSVADRLPGSSTCLVQALAAATLLRRRRIPLALHLGVHGVRRTGRAEIDAHAWVSCRDEVLVGASGHERFTPLVSFRDRPVSVR